jgi:hypothetical protein
MLCKLSDTQFKAILDCRSIIQVYAFNIMLHPKYLRSCRCSLTLEVFNGFSYTRTSLSTRVAL